MERKSNKTWVFVLVIVLAVAALGVTAYALMNEPEKDTKNTSTSSQESSEQASQPKQSAEVGPADAVTPTIIFTDEGFSQETYTFPKGNAIRVVNQSSMDMQFSSDDHPSHRDHTELNLDLLGPGESGTFTPPGPGTFGFHDHINDQYEGTLIIQ